MASVLTLIGSLIVVLRINESSEDIQHPNLEHLNFFFAESLTLVGCAFHT